jgi:hypothetical protein
MFRLWIIAHEESIELECSTWPIDNVIDQGKHDFTLSERLYLLDPASRQRDKSKEILNNRNCESRDESE